MLSLIKKLFGHSTARAKAPQSKTSPHFESSTTMQTVEFANLCLAAILERLPEELKPLVLKLPDRAVTVALPIATIIKQLPGGAVKVSLATLHRQAPEGVLAALPPGDKRMVEVPLAEIFRHIKPTAFKRRNDQRAASAFDSEFSLFGDPENPYQIAPTAPEDAPEVIEPAPEPPHPLKVEPIGVVIDTLVPEFKLARNPSPEPSEPRMIAPPVDIFAPTLRTAPPAAPEKIVAVPAAPSAVPIDPDSITIPLAPLFGGWPEAIKNELVALNGSARVALPKAAVNAGLARGKVTFTWGQIRSWIAPAPGEASAVDAATELILPLKIVAPAFLAGTRKAKPEQRPAEIDAEIPALFNDARAGSGESQMKLAAPTDESAAPPAPVAPDAPVAVETPAAVEAPVAPMAVETPLTFTLETAPQETAPQDAAPPDEPVVETAAAPVVTSVGALFGQPEKVQWTPAELVSNLAKLPGVSGAVVALQEGLLVAHSMPEDVKSEVIAAFLPQLFARLNQYAGEMKLGEVDDLLFTTHGAHCQIYRLGFVYFAVLGKPGESLPWAELRLVADELARQTQKS